MSPELSRRTFLKIFSTAATGLGVAPASALAELTVPGASAAGLNLLKSAIPLLPQVGKFHATGEAARAAFFLLKYPSGILASNSALSLHAARIVGSLICNDRFAHAEGAEVGRLADALLPTRREELRPQNVGMSHFTYLPRLSPMSPDLDLRQHDDDALREYLGRTDPEMRLSFTEREAWGQLVSNGLELRDALRRCNEVRAFADEKAQAGDSSEMYWRSTDGLINTLRHSIGHGNFFVHQMHGLFQTREGSKFPLTEAWQYVEVFSDPARVIPKLMNDRVFHLRNNFMQGYHRVFDEIGRIRNAKDPISNETIESLREATDRLQGHHIEIPEKWSRAVEQHCPAPIRETVPQRPIEPKVEAPVPVTAELGDLSDLLIPLKARRIAKGVELLHRSKGREIIDTKLRFHTDRWSFSARPHPKVPGSFE